MPRDIQKPRNIQEIVDRQLAAWRQEQARPIALPHGPAADQHARPGAITVCFAMGSNGQSIADRTAQQLGLPHHDQDIVQHIASLARVRVETVESLDDHVQSRIDEYVQSLFRERNFDRGDYLQLLCRTVVALWEHGPCVLSGHGTVHIVPRDHALALRLVAPEKVRAERLAQQDQIDLREARRQLHRADAEQAAFHRRFFGAQIEDLEHYDLIVDTSRLPEDAVAELLSQAFRLRFGAPMAEGQDLARGA